MNDDDLATTARVYLDWLTVVKSWDVELCLTCGHARNNHRLRHIFKSRYSKTERKEALAELAKYEAQLRIKSGWARSRIEHE